uniref:NTR domain-containing protein n=1 Tax=Strongyloides papillosus TaxID=174720 RepID=A0A0N5C574_STREA
MKLLIHISAAFVLFLLINLNYFKCKALRKSEVEDNNSAFDPSAYEINNKSREAENICTFCISIYNILHNSSYKLVNASYLVKETNHSSSPINVLFLASGKDSSYVFTNFTGIYYPNNTISGKGIFCDLIKLKNLLPNGDNEIEQNFQQDNTTKKNSCGLKRKKNKKHNKKKRIQML